MVPNESGFNQSETACGLLLAMARDGEITGVYKRQHFLSLRRYNLPSKFRLRNNQIVYCGCNNNAIFSDRVIFTFPTVAVCRPR